MNRNLILMVAAFVSLSFVAVWNGCRVRDSLSQVETHLASANRQRMEIGHLNAGFAATEGNKRLEDSVVALADRVAPGLIATTPRFGRCRRWPIGSAPHHLAPHQLGGRTRTRSLR